MINKDLLYNTGNSTPYCLITCVRKGSDREQIYAYVELSLFAASLKLTQHDKSTTLHTK